MKTFFIALLALLSVLVPSALRAGQIPNDVLKKNFGPKHTFMLTVHGPDPAFIQAGYAFKVNIDGFELSKEMYYDIPVYIAVDQTYGTGGYRLYSTGKDHYSVDLVCVGKADLQTAPPTKRKNSYSPERNPQGEILKRA